MSDWKKYIDLKIDSESNHHPHCEKEKANIFSAYSGGSTEIEVLDFINGLIKLRKPDFVLETGTYKAIGTIAIASALKSNGFGKLISVEKDKQTYLSAKETIGKTDLGEYIDLVNSDSIEFIAKNKISFDVVFIDSYVPVRHKEFVELYRKNNLKDLVLFHDTSRLREESVIFADENQAAYVRELDYIEKYFSKGSIEFYLSRGLRMMQVKQ